MLLSVNSFIVLITFASLTTAKFSGQRHHKVRHKHNTFNLRGKHVNDIREAFDQYRSVLRHTSKQGKLLEYPEIKDVGLSDEYDDTIDNNVKSNSWEPSRRDATRHKVTASFNHNHQPSKYVPPTSNDYFPRNKRIFTTTSTTTPRTTTTSRSNDNYDYYEDDNDASNRRLNDDAQVGSARYNRDSSDNQPAEGETLTDFKMKTLGTMEDVRTSFQKEMSNQNRNNGHDVNHHIRQNMMRTRIDGMCRWANKKVIEMPQQASKMYTPRKYVIYQCSDDTACCGSSDKTCVAKRTEELVLWFHVRYVDATGVEPLKVVNHTECECIYKNRPSTVRSTRLSYSWPMPSTTTTTKAPICKCPSHFDAEDDDDDACGCVCKDSKVECRQRYEGKEGFTMSDQRCILNKSCVQPHCLYGTYSTDSGRCPDKNDKINKSFHGST